MKNKNVLNDVIKKIKNGEELDAIIQACENDLFFNGPVNVTTLEIISLMKEIQPSYFSKYEKRIIRLMGLYFKNNNSEITDLRELIIQDYGDAIFKCRNNKRFTPMQNEILFKIENYDNYSFSSPTSTGKSYIFRYIIENAKKDIMIIVPSRALINEFYINITSYINDKETLIMTFVDDINKAHSKKHIFILTPERARDIFKYKKVFDFEYFLFDEAQLTNEKDERGIYYDGIVRRLKESYPTTKFIFAHPFIDNPNAQFIKNGFVDETKNGYDSFKYRNTGQLFISETENDFYIFGTDKSIMGEQRVKIHYDPIERVLLNKEGCILVYTAKSRIIHKDIFKKFEKYIDKYCEKEPSIEMSKIISLIEPLIKDKKEIYSYFIEYLKRGIVFHHGSMPLEVRVLLEEFIKKGYCKICFATSTLAQGINMPFDLIYIDRFEIKDKLLIRNLIGRAGRSTDKGVFDYGIVVLKDHNKAAIRRLINISEKIDEHSMLDTNDLPSEYVDYRDAIKNNDFSDEYNVPNRIINNIDKENKIYDELKKLKKHFLYSNNAEIYKGLSKIFKYVLGPEREFSEYEEKLLEEANKLLFYRYLGYKLTDVASYIYLDKKEPFGKYKHGFILKYSPIPNTKLCKHIPLFLDNEEVDYDTILYNTYDFYDKLIDLKLMDIYFVTLMKYYIKTNDEFYRQIAVRMKYGTTDEKEIMMMRYGYNSDDFEWLSGVIDEINENEIIFNDNINKLDEHKREKIEKYIY